MTAVALVTANGLNTQAFTLKGATMKTTSSKTSTSTSTSKRAKALLQNSLAVLRQHTSAHSNMLTVVMIVVIQAVV
jgi:hypothetical protein